MTNQFPSQARPEGTTGGAASGTNTPAQPINGAQTQVAPTAASNPRPPAYPQRPAQSYSAQPSQARAPQPPAYPQRPSYGSQPSYAGPPSYAGQQPGFAISNGASGGAANGALVAVAWVIAVATLGYMLPWAVAATRNRPNQASIGLLNFLLGWSLIGWVAALVMACGNDGNGNSNQVVVVNQIHSGTGQ